MRTKWFGYVLVAAALAIVLSVLYLNSRRSQIPLVFSPTQMLAVTWREYKANYLEDGTGRTLDRQRGDITTSEGQSYSMLRAVWMGDKEIFDHEWQWTKDNLRHDNDNLFSWLFGQRPDGSYGILDAQGGQNAASDADTDIALALIFAYARWQDEAYLNDARGIIGDIWEREVILIDGTPYLAANDVEKFSASETAVINPSYLAPYAYRIFARIDSSHPWERLADSSYDLIEASMQAPLDTGASAGLPPDWIFINKRTGALSSPERGALTTHYGYDAMRLPWRLALDHQWFSAPRAKDALDRMQFLSQQYRDAGKLSATYAHDGSVIYPHESPAMYGTALGYFMLSEPDAGKRLYEEKLVFLFNPDRNRWAQTLSYYDDNWAWFGIGLYNNLLPNLAAAIPDAAF